MIKNYTQHNDFQIVKILNTQYIDTKHSETNLDNTELKMLSTVSQHNSK